MTHVTKPTIEYKRIEIATSKADLLLYFLCFYLFLGEYVTLKKELQSDHFACI